MPFTLWSRAPTLQSGRNDLQLLASSSAAAAPGSAPVSGGSEPIGSGDRAVLGLWGGLFRPRRSVQRFFELEEARLAGLDDENRVAETRFLASWNIQIRPPHVAARNYHLPELTLRAWAALNAGSRPLDSIGVNLIQLGRHILVTVFRQVFRNRCGVQCAPRHSLP